MTLFNVVYEYFGIRCAHLESGTFMEEWSSIGQMTFLMPAVTHIGIEPKSRPIQLFFFRLLTTFIVLSPVSTTQVDGPS